MPTWASSKTTSVAGPSRDEPPPFQKPPGFGFPCSTSSAEMISRKAFSIRSDRARRRCSNDELKTPRRMAHLRLLVAPSHSATRATRRCRSAPQSHDKEPLCALRAGQFPRARWTSHEFPRIIRPLFIPKPRMKLSGAIDFPSSAASERQLSACSCPESMMTPSQSKIAPKGGCAGWNSRKPSAVPASRNFLQASASFATSATESSSCFGSSAVSMTSNPLIGVFTASARSANRVNFLSVHFVDHEIAEVVVTDGVVGGQHLAQNNDTPLCPREKFPTGTDRDKQNPAAHPSANSRPIPLNTGGKVPERSIRRARSRKEDHRCCRAARRSPLPRDVRV